MSTTETMDEKNARNARVQTRYDELMREGKHGHYETLFRVVREEVHAALLRANAGQVPEGWKCVAVPTEWTPGPDIFKDWRTQWFGADADEDHLMKAARALLDLAPTQPEQPSAPMQGEVELHKTLVCKVALAALMGRDLDDPYFDGLHHWQSVVQEIARFVPPSAQQADQPGLAEPKQVRWEICKHCGHDVKEPCHHNANPNAAKNCHWNQERTRVLGTGLVNNRPQQAEQTAQGEVCAHGVRRPHECHECANEPSDVEVATWMKSQGRGRAIPDDGPSTFEQRFTESIRLLVGLTPPADLVSGWLDKEADDSRLQEWVIDQPGAPGWAQGIGVIDAAHTLASNPIEGALHDAEQPSAPVYRATVADDREDVFADPQSLAPVHEEVELLRTEIKPRPLAYSLDDYHKAPGSAGPLAFQWEDKPHRLVYDLIAAVKFYATPPSAQQAEQTAQALPEFDALPDEAIDNACAAGAIYRVDLMRAWESLRKDLPAPSSPPVAQDAQQGQVDDDEWWIDLAQRHANADWNSYKPDGYLNAVKAVVNDALRSLPTSGGEPWGWAVVDKDGSAQAIRPRIKEFFGSIQIEEPLTQEHVSKFNRDWRGLAPHRLITLYEAPPTSAGEQARQGMGE